MKIISISDLHIQGADDLLYRSLLRLMNEELNSGDIFVLGGDIFDLFVGKKKCFLKRYNTFLENLCKLGDRGVSVYYIEGNHDFFIQKVFANSPGITVSKHHVSLPIEGKRFYFAHGDTVNNSDFTYRTMRAFYRSPLIRFFVFVAPVDWFEWIKEKSASSNKQSSFSSDRLRRLYRSFAAKKLTEGYDFVVLGHCHDADEMSFKIGDKLGQYINNGYPREHRMYLEWKTDSEKIIRKSMPGL